ncbi:hypothetical protein HYS03_00840 [Candidatus Woesebacteria bacterium]|nr:hypothetical protein [Candidatus Woesebacteria bacterium]QQG47208.1 MAG: hypothetical protein HY044_03650 [Candidatus Woesebacteria bacterium]
MKIDFKSFVIIEATLLAAMVLFSLDLLPRNYNEFQKICTEMWANDAKQYQICMGPYFRQTNLDKYIIGATIIALVSTPVFFKKKK